MLLQGYKVVELGTYIAAPGAASMMARWGADVVKVEGLGGDPIRWVRPIYRPDIPPNFEIDNHSKQSVEVRTVFRSVYARKRREQNGPRR